MSGLAAAELGILDWIAMHCHSGLLDTVMPAITHLGDRGILWIILGVVLLVASKQSRSTGGQILLALLVSLLLCNLLLKNWTARIRPCDWNTAVELLIPRQTDWSFPSGHTSASFAAVTVLFLRRHPWRWAALVLGCAIAFSRLYLYVHFPTDVLCGLGLGVLCGFLAVALWNRWSGPVGAAYQKHHRSKPEK